MGLLMDIAGLKNESGMVLHRCIGADYAYLSIYWLRPAKNSICTREIQHYGGGLHHQKSRWRGVFGGMPKRL